MEIERKFLVAKLPEDLEQYPCSCIEQAYLSTKPVIRVRRKDDRYILTCKGQGLLTREEHELFLSQEEYESLLARAEGRIITKKRYRIPCQELLIELDVFTGALAPLVMAEVEFSTVEEANHFVPPDWFGQDVTFDPAYHNSNMSRRIFQKTTVAPASCHCSPAHGSESPSNSTAADICRVAHREV